MWRTRGGSSTPEKENPDERGPLLLGIKYEAARIGGVDNAALSKISGQLENEVGEDWPSDPLVLQGRNAVRQEYGMPRLGEAPPPPEPPSRPWYRRLLGGR